VSVFDLYYSPGTACGGPTPVQVFPTQTTKQSASRSGLGPLRHWLLPQSDTKIVVRHRTGSRQPHRRAQYGPSQAHKNHDITVFHSIIVISDELRKLIIVGGIVLLKLVEGNISKVTTIVTPSRCYNSSVEPVVLKNAITSGLETPPGCFFINWYLHGSQ